MEIPVGLIQFKTSWGKSRDKSPGNKGCSSSSSSRNDGVVAPEGMPQEKQKLPPSE